MLPRTKPAQPKHAGQNLCLQCGRYIDGKCTWRPGDYCKITRSK